MRQQLHLLIQFICMQYIYLTKLFNHQLNWSMCHLTLFLFWINLDICWFLLFYQNRLLAYHVNLINLTIFHLIIIINVLYMYWIWSIVSFGAHHRLTWLTPIAIMWYLLMIFLDSRGYTRSTPSQTFILFLPCLLNLCRINFHPTLRFFKVIGVRKF